MAMTAQVKAELSSTQITKTCCRKAEVASMLRFAGGLHIVSGRIVVEAELDTGAAARRLRKDVAEVYGAHSDVVMVQGNGLRKGSRYIVRVVRDGEALARQTGLLDQRGRPVRGLPPAVVSGGACDAVAAWRGAFLAHGSLTEPGRSSSLEVTCPGSEAALALVGVARRLGISAKAREVRGVDRVVIRDGDAIGQLLTRLGAHESLMAWEERRMRREVRATANRLANFDDANLRRSARAAVAAGARVERALEILGDEVPDHLKLAGSLRVEHKQASLEELGQLHEPVLTKDAIAGRIRRLLAMADKRAEELGIPTVAVYQTDLVGFALRYGIAGGPRAMARLTTRIHGRVARTLAPSSASMRQLADLGIGDTHLWPRGVDLEGFHPGRRDEALREQLAPDGRLLVGYVGRLAAEKELDLLVHLHADPRFRLVLVGGGPEEGKLRRLLPVRAGGAGLRRPGRGPAQRGTRGRRRRRGRRVPLQPG